jgi:hypothetical protein
MGITGKFCTHYSKLTKALFNVGGASAGAFFISLISGYPLGAKTVADLKKGGLLSSVEAQRACAFCSTVSPVYAITGVGLMAFSNRLFGLLLYTANVISAIIIGVIFSFYKRKEKPTNIISMPIKCDNLFYEGVFTAVNSVLFLGAIIILSTVFCDCLLTLAPFNALIKGFNGVLGNVEITKGVITGFIEYTYGIRIISNVGLNFWSLPTCALLCGFGGISVNLQSICFLKGANIKILPYLLAKIGQGVICFFLGLIFNLFIF